MWHAASERAELSGQGKDSRMKATWLYRTAAVLLVLFAAGHTYGFL